MDNDDDKVVDAKNDATAKPKTTRVESSTPAITDPNHSIAAKLQSEALELRKREKLDKEPYVIALKARIAELEAERPDASTETVGEPPAKPAPAKRK